MGRKAGTDVWYRRPMVVVPAIIIASLLLGYAGWKATHWSGVRACRVSEGDYRLAQFFDKEGKLELTVYSYPYKDQTSEELLFAAKNGGSAPAALYHKFYKTEVCKNQTSCSGLVLDVGASLGTHALWMAKLGMEVHAFEPLKDNSDLLRCSANANGFRKLFVVNEGVSDHVGQECLIPPGGQTMTLALFAPRVVGNCSHYAPAAVPVVSIDHYWENVLGKQQIDFIKIDAEAHELYVLQGAQQMLATSPPPMMLMEYYPKMLMLKSVQAENLTRLIRESGYRIYDCQAKKEILAGSAGVKALDKYKETVTDLLLLHTKTYPANQPLKKYQCGY